MGETHRLENEKMGIDFSSIGLLDVLSHFDEGVIIADLSGKIVFYNRVMGKIDDLDPMAVIGKKVTEIYDLSNQTSILLRCIKTARPIVNDPLIYKTRFGKTAYTVDSALPLYNAGKLIGAVCFVKDYHLMQKAFDLAAKSLQPVRTIYNNGTSFTFNDIAGRNREFQNAIAMAKMASESLSSVMIMGETGTGKELFAQSMHNISERKNYPYIAVNCAAIPENLLEGMLFGTCKGAFTGAIDKPGLFERANGGTIFLDEINSMPIGLQAKLLRVLQEKRLRRVGGLNETSLDLKVVSSVNSDPHRAIQEGNLRMDLFYRLAVIYIRIPSLRERPEDISLLAHHFIAVVNGELKRNVHGISRDVMDFFQIYLWPGNIRELKNTIESAINLMPVKDKIIEKHHLPLYFSDGYQTLTKTKIMHVANFSEKTEFNPGDSSADLDAGGPSLPDRRLALEEELIFRALKACGGNVSMASRDLGISRQLLRYKMKKSGLERQTFLR